MKIDRWTLSSLRNKKKKKLTELMLGDSQFQILKATKKATVIKMLWNWPDSALTLEQNFS